MDHGRILSRSWEITWNNRALWGLGFLAALAGGGGGGGGGNIDPSALNFNADSPEGVLEALNDTPFGPLLDGDAAMLATIASIAAVAVVLVLLIAIVFWLLGTTARAGLITSVVGLEHGEKITFGNAFRQGWKHIWRLFLLVLLELALIGLPVLIIVGGLVGIGVATGSGAVGLIAVPLICILVIAGFLLQFAHAFGFRSIVLKNMGPVEALSHGWSLFKANAGDIIILAILYGVITMVAGFISLAVLGIFIAASPLLSLLVTGEATVASIVLAVLGGLVATVLGAIVMSIFTAWQSTGFTLAYLEMNGEAVEFKEKDPKDFPGADMEFI